MSAEPVRRRKNRKTNTSLGIPHTFSFPLLPTHECRAVNLHIMTLKILFHMNVKWGTRRSAGHGREALLLYRTRVSADGRMGAWSAAHFRYSRLNEAARGSRGCRHY